MSMISIKNMTMWWKCLRKGHGSHSENVKDWKTDNFFFPAWGSAFTR